MFGWRKTPIITPKVDIHSHLIPSIDDGVKSLDNTIDVIKKFREIGYEKMVTTPHIHPNYPNSPDIILKGLDAVQEKLIKENIHFEIEGAAEYFVDEIFFQVVKESKKILFFGSGFVLIESSFVNKPLFFESCLFELQSKGYQPVLAHPERYQFLEGELEWLLQLSEMGVLFQVTVSSFVGYYGSMPQKIAKSLLKRNMIDFIGSDLHHWEQIKYLEEGLQLKSVKKLCGSSHLKNNLLL